MDKYLEDGKQIYEEYCSTADNTPTMLPRAPEQTYIDAYPAKDPAAGPSFADDKRHQLDYETEVKVYRALEEVDGNFIVLHSFKFTHHQYRLCAGESHIRKGCPKCKGKNASNQDGECDFLIICADKFIIIEVKNMGNIDGECTTNKLKALIGTYRKSVEQRNKVVELIKCIDKNANILQFTAYPNFSKQFKDQFQFSKMTELRLSDDELSTIIFEEDFSRNKLKKNWISRLVSFFSRRCKKYENSSNFVAWWAANVTQANSPSSDSHKKVRNILLAIWATESKTCDKSKCSLGRCIMDVNKELKEGRITFEPKKGKNRDQNPGVVKAPDVISRCVGVINLTTQQNDVFYSSEKLLWINGPAGAGKTVILCGKIIQLLQSDRDSKVVVFKVVGEGNNSQHYQHALDKASIEYKLISTSKDKHTPAQLADLITESSCSVIIVEIQITDVFNRMTLLIDRLSVLSGYNLFVDDIQSVIDYKITTVMCIVLIDKLLELSADKTVWIACDVVQVWALLDKDISIVANLLTDKLTPNQRATLTMNLRNTSDLSNILSVIRDQFVRLCSLKSDILDLVLPTQLQGHFIHGPLPVIQVFNNYNVDSIIRVFDIELDGLCTMEEFDYSDIGIVVNVTSNVFSLVKNSVNMRCDNTDSKIAVCDIEDCASAQWPAVILLHTVWDREEYDLTQLYLALSRARVYCSVIICPPEGRTLSDTPHMLQLLGKLSNYARIIRY